MTPFAAFDIGSLPNPALGGGLALAALPGSGVAVGLAGALWATEQGTVPSTSRVQGADFKLITGDLSGCYALVRGTLELSPCAILEIATVSATGFGAVSNNPQTSATWFSVGLGARLRWEPTRHFGVALDVDGVIPTLPYHKFVITGAEGGTVYSTQSVAVRSFLGPELRF